MRNRFGALCVVLLALLGRLPPATAQPADCQAAPATATMPQTMPMSLALKGLPGVPAGIDGYVGVDIPVAPSGLACADGPLDQPALPADVLQGTPGDVLRGDGSGHVLSGGRVPRVEVIDVR